jgi:hypothetical protein
MPCCNPRQSAWWDSLPSIAPEPELWRSALWRIRHALCMSSPLMAAREAASGRSMSMMGFLSRVVKTHLGMTPDSARNS